MIVVDFDVGDVANVQRTGGCTQAQQAIAEMRLDLDPPFDLRLHDDDLVQYALLRRARARG